MPKMIVDVTPDMETAPEFLEEIAALIRTHKARELGDVITEATIDDAYERGVRDGRRERTEAQQAFTKVWFGGGEKIHLSTDCTWAKKAKSLLELFVPDDDLERKKAEKAPALCQYCFGLRNLEVTMASLNQGSIKAVEPRQERQSSPDQASVPQALLQQ